MRNPDELRTALTELERHAPRAQVVLRDVGHRAAVRRRRRVSGIVAVTAGAAAVAVAIALSAPATPQQPGQHATAAGQPACHPAAHPAKVKLTARAVLLTAAVNAAKATATGRYWVVAEKTMLLLGAGPHAHPYNIADYSSSQNWAPRSASLRSWIITRDGGARPATPADRAAWRLAGSPDSWAIGGGFKTSGAAAQGFWQPGSGDVGYLGTAVTAATLRSLPASLAGLKAIMRKAARGGEGMFSVGVQLLQDPVTPHIRANVYRVLATLPGVRLTPITTDPLGRSGRGVAMPGNGAEEVLVISPATGELLSDEFVVTTPGLGTDVSAYTAAHNGCRVYQSIGLSKAQERKAAGGLTEAQCAPFGFFGITFHGQVESYNVYTREGWTNASPTLPATQVGPGQGPG